MNLHAGPGSRRRLRVRQSARRAPRLLIRVRPLTDRNVSHWGRGGPTCTTVQCALRYWRTAGARTSSAVCGLLYCTLAIVPWARLLPPGARFLPRARPQWPSPVLLALLRWAMAAEAKDPTPLRKTQWAGYYFVGSLDVSVKVVSARLVRAFHPKKRY